MRKRYGTAFEKRNNHEKYEYVNIHIGKFCGARSGGLLMSIQQKANVGYMPTNISDYGKIKDLGLVFEIDF